MLPPITSTMAGEDTILAISPLNASRAEGALGSSTPLTFLIRRSGATTGRSSVLWSVSGTAVTPSDFRGGVFPSGTVSFAQGQTTRTLTIQVAGDAALEAEETFQVSLANPSPGTTIRPGAESATGTIRNDDPLPVVSVVARAASLPEGHQDATPFTFLLSRRGDSSGSSSVRWAVAGSGASAANAADFSGGVLPSGTVTFAAGETSTTLTVMVKGDSMLEANETFRLSLASPVGATLSATAAAASGTIKNDDSLLAIAPLAATKQEGRAGTTTPFTFTVSRTGQTTGESTAAWAVVGSGANAASAADFIGGAFPSGRVTFAAGQTARTLTVLVAGDSRFEPTETFQVSLFDPSAGTNLRSNASSATGTITPSDLASNSTTQAELNGRSSLSSQIDWEGDQDWIRINTKPGNYYYLTATANGLNPQVDVVTGERVVIAKALAFDKNTARSSMGLMSTDGKPLFARVRMQGNFSGAYQITLHDLGTAAEIKQEVLRLTNNARSDAGKGELVANPLLERAAQGHTDDMLRSGKYLAHTGSDGSDLKRRLERVGYAPARAGENAASNYYSPSELVNAWLASPGHQQNLLFDGYEELGVGFSVDFNSGATYWIQNLGLPM